MRKVLLILLSVAFISAGFAGTSFALPSDLILDTYLHPNDVDASQVSRDVIGEKPLYDFYGYRWTDMNTLEIWTGWNKGLDGQARNAKLGDVFLLDAGNTAVALRNHGGVAGFEYNNKYGAQEVGDMTGQGEVFSYDNFYMSDDYYVGASTTAYGDHEMVAAYGEAWENVWADVNINQVDGDYVITLDFYASLMRPAVTFEYPDLVISKRLSHKKRKLQRTIARYEDAREAAYKLFLANAEDIEPIDGVVDFDKFGDSAIRLAQTCGNDVMLHSVPEPATLLLLGTGLIGLAGFGRRKFKNR